MERSKDKKKTKQKKNDSPMFDRQTTDNPGEKTTFHFSLLLFNCAFRLVQTVTFTTPI
jgi:hypothetical protein